MSSYQGRTGPNFSEYLNNLNTVSPPYDPAHFTEDLVDFGNDLSMFTNTDFTQIDDVNLNFGDLPLDTKANLYEEFIPTSVPPQVSNPTQIKSPVYSNYNTPIQPAPVANFPQVQPAQHGNQAPQRKKAESASPVMSAEERSRLAAEEDKRRRNTAASARFRVKKKQREQSLEKTVKEVQDKNAKLEAKLNQLEMENKWLKEIITEKHGLQSKEEMAAAYSKFRKESEERDLTDSSEHTTGVGTN